MTEPMRLPRTTPGAALALRTALWIGVLLGTASCGRGGDDSPRAVFLVVVDTLRPDRLSCYGYDEHETTNIDRLAALGTRFTEAHSVASWTIPSMGAMLTSLYPGQMGLVEKPVPPETRLEWREARVQLEYTIPDHASTLAEMLRESGYRAAGFVNQPGLNARGGFFQGFTDWFYPASPTEIREHDPTQTLPPGRWPPFLSFAAHIDSCLVEEFERWLSRHRERRVFVFLHLLTPHLPYVPPRRFMPPEAVANPTLVSDSELYDGEIRTVDAMIGEVVRTIEEQVGLERSIVVFTSDHGEAIGEHGMTEHGHSLHREVIQVPLILVAPGIPAGRAVESYVRTIDILPTLLDLVGRPPPSDLQGESLVPLCTAAGPDRTVFSEAMLYGGTERSLISDGFKLMYDEQEDRSLLFDVASDPGELVDLAAEDSARVDSMRAALDERHETFRRDYRGTGTATEPVEALRALGYVGD